MLHIFKQSIHLSHVVMGKSNVGKYCLTNFQSHGCMHDPNDPNTAATFPL